jgi:hypothetical protein
MFGCDPEESVLEEAPDHREAVDACLRADARLPCLREANDALAAAVLRETGSETIVLDPLAKHRELGAALCDADDCEADLELLLAEMMDVYLEGHIVTPPQPLAFAHCHHAMHEAVLIAADDLEITIATLGFAFCVESTIASQVGEDALLTEHAPAVADAICILLTARAGDDLTADRVLRCQADYQIALFESAY